MLVHVFKDFAQPTVSFTPPRSPSLDLVDFDLVAIQPSSWLLGLLQRLGIIEMLLQGGQSLFGIGLPRGNIFQFSGIFRRRLS